jgi:hypothetical protein
MLELGALLECIGKKEGIESLKIKAMSKCREDKSTVEKISSGKFTIGGMFKSKDGKATESQRIL